MFSFFRAAISLTLLLLIINSTASAQIFEQAHPRPVLEQQASHKNKMLTPNSLYAVDISCQPIGDLVNPSIAYFKNRNRSLFVLITTGTPVVVSAATTSDKLPADIIAAMQVYSIGTDSATKQQIVVDFRNCKKSFLTRGLKNLKIITTENYLDDFNNTVFGDVLSGALGLISPIFGLFTGGPLPALISGQLSNGSSVRDNTAKILTALNRGLNKTQSTGLERPLRQGKYSFKTEFVKLTISIRPVSSIVLDSNSDFKADLVTKIKATNDKADSKDIDQSCRAARTDLIQLGITAPIDLAYGVSQIAEHAGFNKNNLISCLTPDLAKAASKGGDLFWADFTSDVRINDVDVSSVQSGQPEWAAVKSFMNDLAVHLGQYSRNDPPLPEAVEALSKQLAPDIVIADQTSSIAFGLSKTPIERDKVLQLFLQKGFFRFGCVAPTTNADSDIDGATSMLLIVKASKDATTAPLDSVLVVRPLFKDNKISSGIDRLTISDNRAWIVTALTSTRNYDCNGFSIEKPATPPGRPTTTASN